MDAMQYAEGVVKEFLLFRGFTHTLQSFESELHADVGNGFQVDRILDLIFMVYVPRFEADKLLNLMGFLDKLFFASADVWYQTTVKKLEASLKRYYLVHALQKGRPDRVLDFYEHYGESFLRTGDDCHAWFALPYMKNPNTDPRFQVYFTKEWLDTLILSLRNFLCEVFEGIQLPTLLKFTKERGKAADLQEKLEQLQTENLALHETLEAKDTEISNLRRALPRDDGVKENSLGRSASDHSSTLVMKASSKTLATSRKETDSPPPSQVASAFVFVNVTEDKKSSDVMGFSSRLSKTHQTTRAAADDTINSTTTPGRTILEHGDSIISERGDEISQVAVEFQETFSGHTSPIMKCRFSATGANIASASADGNVRIWALDNAAATSRNAAICTGVEVMSLEWEYKSDRLLLLGTAERRIKAWNVEAKRVVCDLSTEAAFPRVLDLKCSPTDPVFCCAAASKTTRVAEGVDGLGFGSLTIWNMRTWKTMSVLPLGEDPPVMTSVCFNHNGKILACGATDGMIRLFDLRGNLPITGWPAHESCVSCVRFSHDQASIFSLGADGKVVSDAQGVTPLRDMNHLDKGVVEVLEWSLHNQGQILQSQDASEYCAVSGARLPRHEMAIDSVGRHVLLTSNLTRSPLYQWEGLRMTQKTLEHSAAITSVDWHPSLPMYLTGSADHSVRVTSVAP